MVDEILEYVGNQKPVQRILLNALDEKSVRQALCDLHDNTEFEGLKKSALARSRADWLIGINLTRAFTRLAQQAGYSGVWRVGRVKTPTMALVVRREREIRAFQPKKHYKLEAQFQHVNGVICAVWQPDENFQGLDREGRVLQRDDAEAVLRQVNKSANAKIIKCVSQQHTEQQVLPYSLSALQIAAGKKYGYSPKLVLDTAPKLYEAKLTTYPRSDCDFLPENQLADTKQILNNLAKLPGWEKRLKKADPAVRSRAWNDQKISVHHAIIPTRLYCEIDKLDEAGRNIYLMIAQAYLAQFYPVRTYSQTNLVIAAAGYCFTASGKNVICNGWRELYGNEEKEQAEEVLPKVDKGDSVTFKAGEVKEQLTKAPKRFTSAALLEAMKNVHKYLRDPSFKNSLKTVSGIGTEATRAGIIDELISGGLLKQEKKSLVPTEIAEILFDAMTDSLTYPDMTAIWEDKLAQIAAQDFSYESFESDSAHRVQELLKEALAAKITPPKNQPLCPGCKKPIVHLKGSRGLFWKCSGCGVTFEDVKGIPAVFACPSCKKGFLRKRFNKAKGNSFWGCNRYPACNAVVNDKGGKPKL